MSVMNSFDLTGKVAIVTGGSSGIGKAIARGLAEAGAAVAIAARNAEHNEQTVAELAEAGLTTIAVQTDITSREALEALRDTVTRRLGPVDVLVNNAGMGIHSEALELSDEDWDRVMATNLTAVWRASQIIGEQMVARGVGSVINIGSMSGLIVNRPQWHAPYAISKAGVHHLTKSLAAEWAPKGVRVNAIAPGYVKTGIAEIDRPEYRHYWVDEVPMQRYALPAEIAPTAVYLASAASSFMTGTVLVIDGGYTLW